VTSRISKNRDPGAIASADGYDTSDRCGVETFVAPEAGAVAPPTLATMLAAVLRSR
jgi:hypothetical protein